MAQALEPTQQAPRNENVPEVRIQSLASSSALPGALGREFTRSPRIRAPRHAHTPTHADTCVRTLAHTRSHSHMLSPPPLWRAIFGGVGQGRADPRAASTSNHPCVYLPSEIVTLLRSEFLWPVCLPLPKVKSSHETKLKALEQSMKTFATHGALRFLELK